MSSYLSAYYLPVTEAVANDFVALGTVPLELIERVALLVMLVAGQSKKRSDASLSRALFDLYDQFLDKPKDLVEAQLANFRDEAKVKDFGDLHASLLGQGIRFAPKEKMESRAWCGADGHYTELFQDWCRDTLVEYEITIEPEADTEYPSDDDDYGYDRVDEVWGKTRRRISLRGPLDQARVARAIMAASDEHFSMSAYAGTGKTHLLLALAEAGGRYTHLAPTVAHQQAFSRRSGTMAAIKSITMYGLANRMAEELVRKRSTRWINPPRMEDSTWTSERQVAALGLSSIAGDPPALVLMKILRIIAAWCYSDDNEINVEHARRVVHIGTLDDMVAYVEWAQKVWTEMSASLPRKQERMFTFRLYHLVKWLDVNGANIPCMGTLLLDEAHDLSAPWYSMLRRYSQGWVAMGDPYQCLSGKAPTAPHAKALVMAQSVRTGEQAIPFVQTVIGHHSEMLVDDQIRGSRDHVTRPRPYSPREELPHTGLRVYGSVWRLLEDALRIKNGGGRFRLVQASEKELEKVVGEAILMRQSGDLPKSYQLRQFKTWEALSQHLEVNGHANVVRLFERGFNKTKLDELLASQGASEQGSLNMGMLEHCKNLEFSTVAMSGCCFPSSLRALPKAERDKQVKAIYVAMTRVKDELWLPGDAIDQLSG